MNMRAIPPYNTASTNTNTTPWCSLLHIRTLGCGKELKVGAVRCVSSSGASAHMEDVDSRGSEARYHHAGGFGPRWWVAQLLLLLGKHRQIARDDKQEQVFGRQMCVCINPLSQQRLKQNT